MYFRQFWKDPRLIFNPDTTGFKKAVVVGLEDEDVWIPDTVRVIWEKGRRSVRMKGKW